MSGPEMNGADRLRELIARLPAVIPGGCDWCNAEQRIHDDGSGVFRIEIAHDPDCIDLVRREWNAAHRRDR